jgi:hypothetical protein
MNALAAFTQLELLMSKLRLPILVQLLAAALIPLPRLRRASGVAAEPDDRMLQIGVLRAFRRRGPRPRVTHRFFTAYGH